MSFSFNLNYVIIRTNRVKVSEFEILYERKWNMPASKKKKEMHNVKESRRKRVKRLKTMIVAGAVILLFASVILNFVLLFKVLRLEGQIDKLYSQTNIAITQDDLYL